MPRVKFTDHLRRFFPDLRETEAVGETVAEVIYGVVYRHALDVSGDCLAFGTTTGNVFVSDNRGDSWYCLGHHFPPVYSVRFAALA